MFKYFLITGLVVFCLFSCNSNKNKNTYLKGNANSNDSNNPRINLGKSSSYKKINLKDISGTWMKACDGESGHISIPDSLKDEVTIEVNSNQIVIGAKIDTSNFNKDRRISFRLTNPGELGEGGAKLEWKTFSRDSVIATMAFIDSSKAKLCWYGFYDKYSHKRVWVHNFAMLLDTNGTVTSLNEVDVINCDH